MALASNPVKCEEKTTVLLPKTEGMLFWSGVNRAWCNKVRGLIPTGDIQLKDALCTVAE